MWIMLCSIVFPLLCSGHRTTELKLGVMDTDIFTRLIKINMIFSYYFILGKTILRSSKFKDIEIWNQQYVDKQKDSRIFLVFIWIKGQLISNVFLASSILPKNEWKNSTLLLWSLKSNCLVRFLRELKIPKIHFENNWPLVKVAKVSFFLNLNFYSPFYLLMLYMAF